MQLGNKTHLLQEILVITELLVIGPYTDMHPALQQRKNRRNAVPDPQVACRVMGHSGASFSQQPDILFIDPNGVSTGYVSSEETKIIQVPQETFSVLLQAV